MDSYSVLEEIDELLSSSHGTDREILLAIDNLVTEFFETLREDLDDEEED